jgi:tetratricopeptide (TPR) repeat protein
MRKVKIYIAIIGLSIFSLETLGNINTDYIDQGKSRLTELDIENAIRSFSKAIEKNHKIVDAYLHRAQAYLISGDCDKVAEDYSKALELDPVYVQKQLNTIANKQSDHSTVFDYTDPKYYE